MGDEREINIQPDDFPDLRILGNLWIPKGTNTIGFVVPKGQRNLSSVGIVTLDGFSELQYFAETIV